MKYLKGTLRLLFRLLWLPTHPLIVTGRLVVRLFHFPIKATHRRAREGLLVEVKLILSFSFALVERTQELL